MSDKLDFDIINTFKEYHKALEHGYSIFDKLYRDNGYRLVYNGKEDQEYKLEYEDTHLCEKSNGKYSIDIKISGHPQCYSISIPPNIFIKDTDTVCKYLTKKLKKEIEEDNRLKKAWRDKEQENRFNDDLKDYLKLKSKLGLEGAEKDREKATKIFEKKRKQK